MKSNFYGQRQMNDALRVNGRMAAEHTHTIQFCQRTLALSGVGVTAILLPASAEPLEVSVKLFNSSFDYFPAKTE